MLENTKGVELTEVREAKPGKTETEFGKKKLSEAELGDNPKMSTGIRVERAVAELLLQQLKKKLELQEKCDPLLRRQKLVEAENGIEAAALKARILEADTSSASISAEHERFIKVQSASFKTECLEQKSSMDEQKYFPLLQHDHYKNDLFQLNIIR